MQIDPAIVQAYAVLESAFYTDCLRTVPSRHNLEYRQWLEHRFLLRIGRGLHTLPDTRYRLWIAHLVQRFFWADMGLSERPNLPTELPIFLWPAGYQLPPLDIPAMAASLQALTTLDKPPLCIAERKFARLTEQLHMRPAEAELLQLAYAADAQGAPAAAATQYEPDAQPLNAVLALLFWDAPADRSALFAMLLAVTPDEADALFVPPVAVLAMHFIDTGGWHTRKNALACATATDKLLPLLETRHLTQAAFWADMEATSGEVGIAFDTDYPMDLLYEELPPNVAETYVAGRRGKALSAPQLATLVWWQTGLQLSTDAMAPLAGKLQFVQVIQTLISATIACRKAGGSLDVLTVQDALCNAQ